MEIDELQEHVMGLLQVLAKAKRLPKGENAISLEQSIKQGKERGRYVISIFRED